MTMQAFYGYDGSIPFNTAMLNFYKTWVLPVPGTDMTANSHLNEFQTEFMHIWLLSRGQTLTGSLNGDTRKFLLQYQALSDTGQPLDQLWYSVGAFVGPLAGP